MTTVFIIVSIIASFCFLFHLIANVQQEERENIELLINSFKSMGNVINDLHDRIRDLENKIKENA